MPPKRKVSASAEDEEAKPATVALPTTAEPKGKRAKTTKAAAPAKEVTEAQEVEGVMNEEEEAEAGEGEKPKGKGKGKAKGKAAAKEPAKAEAKAVVARQDSQIATLVGEDALDELEEDEGAPAAPLMPIEMPTSYDYAKAPEDQLKIVSYNLDGFKSACDNKMGAYCAAEDADVVCFQETKMTTTSIFMNMVYPHQYWSFSTAKTGYAGTAILSKVKPLSVTYGLGKSEHDTEGRTIVAEFEDFYLVNTDVPNSGMKLERLSYRATWDADLQALIKSLDQKKPVVWTGDLNVAHTEIDLSKPEQNKRTAGFTQQERDSFGKLLGEGFVDSFREMNQGKTGQYTFWGKRHAARAKNIGWRLDYFVVSQRFLPNIAENLIRPEVWKASDHVPIVLLLKGLKFVRK